MTTECRRSPIIEAPPGAADRIARAREDVAAFGDLCGQHYDVVYRYCRRRLLPHDQAEDLTADVFLKVVGSFDRFRGDEPAFRVWLYRLATNCANEHLRKRKRRQALLEGLAQESRAHTASAAADDRADEAVAVKQALLSLSVCEQAAVALRYFEDLKHNEIAAIVGGSAATVRSRISRALARMQKLLEGGQRVRQPCA